MPRAYLADCLDKGTTNPELPECGRYAEVVKVDHRVRVAQRCLRPPDDLRIDIAGWLRADPREKQNVFGLGKQLTDSRWGKALRSGRLNNPGSAVACTPCTSRLRAEMASASASVAGAITISMAMSSRA
jgi:hypothetical protein